MAGVTLVNAMVQFGHDMGVDRSSPYCCTEPMTSRTVTSPRKHEAEVKTRQRWQSHILDKSLTLVARLRRRIGVRNPILPPPPVATIVTHTVYPPLLAKQKAVAAGKQTERANEAACWH